MMFITYGVGVGVDVDVDWDSAKWDVTEFIYKISLFLYKGDGKSEIKVKLRGLQLERYVKAMELSVTTMLLLAPRGEWHTARNESEGVGMCSCKAKA